MNDPFSKRRRLGRALFQHAIALTWGFAEATVFFVVPDAWTSAVGLRRPARAQALTLTATAGAALGGAAVHRWSARTDPVRSAALAARIPAISPAMVAKVDAQMCDHGFRAMMIGPFTGTSYKLYARSAGVQSMPLGRLLVWTIPARLARFVPATGAISGIAVLARRCGLSAPDRGLPRLLGVSPRTVELTIFLLGWAAFYTWFFRSVGRELSAQPLQRLNDGGACCCRSHVSPV